MLARWLCWSRPSTGLHCLSLFEGGQLEPHSVWHVSSWSTARNCIRLPDIKWKVNNCSFIKEKTRIQAGGDLGNSWLRIVHAECRAPKSNRSVEMLAGAFEYLSSISGSAKSEMRGGYCQAIWSLTDAGSWQLWINLQSAANHLDTEKPASDMPPITQAFTKQAKRIQLS